MPFELFTHLTICSRLLSLSLSHIKLLPFLTQFFGMLPLFVFWYDFMTCFNDW